MHQHVLCQTTVLLYEQQQPMLLTLVQHVRVQHVRVQLLLLLVMDSNCCCATKAAAVATLNHPPAPGPVGTPGAAAGPQQPLDPVCAHLQIAGPETSRGLAGLASQPERSKTNNRQDHVDW